VASKAKAPVKAAKKPAAKAVTKTKAKPKGLVLSSAQWKAYNKAYNAVASAAAQRVALAKAAQRFRKYRLQSAYSTIKASNVVTHNARTAAIAAFAAKMSWQQAKHANQNKALNARIELDAYNHANMAGRLQFAQAGVKAYAHAAVMRTVDTQQALSYERKIFAAAARAAKSGKKSVVKKSTKRTAIGAAINAQASAAGLKAAKAVKGTSKVASAKAKTATAKAPVKKATGSQSAKAPAAKAKARTAPYLGIMRTVTFDGNGYWHHGRNEFEGTCIMTAVANALHHQTKWRLPDEDIAYWTGRAGPEPTIGGVLDMLWSEQPWPQVHLTSAYQVYTYTDRTIVGYRVESGDHAAYSPEIGKVVSWGEVLDAPLLSEIEEIWTCEFRER
jgi:hypothetical protein